MVCRPIRETHGVQHEAEGGGEFINTYLFLQRDTRTGGGEEGGRRADDDEEKEQVTERGREERERVIETQCNFCTSSCISCDGR